MNYSCIIVDDEPLAIEVIKTHLIKTGLFNIIAECSNANEAFQVIKMNEVDLMFLDIQMPGLKGTDFLKCLNNPPKVILTTAFREYAIEGFDLNVVDYLLKPIAFERFVKAVDKFLDIVAKTHDSQTDNQYIYLNINKKIHKINVSEIIYAESIKDYVTIHTLTEKIVAKHTLSSLGDMLPDCEFVRVHRSFIVSIPKIKGFNSQFIDMGGIELPIGPNYQTNVFEKLNYPYNKL